MAKITTCDGTGVEIPEDTPTTGFFGHQYSDEARKVAEAYLEELNGLQTQAAQTLQARLDELRKAYRERLRQLPDEP